MTDTGRCLCGKKLTAAPTGRPRKWCDDACRLRHYRQRQRVRRDRNAQHDETRRLADIATADQARWTRFLTAHGKLSRPRAERLYTLMIEHRMIDGPFEQLTIDQYRHISRQRTT